MFKRFVVLIPFLFTIGAAHAIGTVPAVNSLILDDEFTGCAWANGLLWCRYLNGDPAPAAASCNQVCAEYDKVPIADDAAWTAAQNTPMKCEAVRNAVGLADAAVQVGLYAFACAEHFGFNNTFYCSTAPQCPSDHRITADYDDTTTSICPCE